MENKKLPGLFSYFFSVADEAIEGKEFLVVRWATLALLVGAYLAVWIYPSGNAFLSSLTVVTIAYGFWVYYAYKRHRHLQDVIIQHEGRLKPRLEYVFENGMMDCYSDDDGPHGDRKKSMCDLFEASHKK